MAPHEERCDRCIPCVKTWDATAHVNTREACSNTWALNHCEFLRTRTTPCPGPCLIFPEYRAVGGLRQAPKFTVVRLSLCVPSPSTLAGLQAFLWVNGCLKVNSQNSPLTIFLSLASLPLPPVSPRCGSSSGKNFPSPVCLPMRHCSTFV